MAEASPPLGISRIEAMASPRYGPPRHTKYDIVIVGGALVFQTVTQSLTMRPLMISKVNTVVQLLLAISVLFVGGYGIEDGPTLGVMGYIVVVTTLWSGLAYVITWSRLAAEIEKTGSSHPGE